MARTRKQEAANRRRLRRWRIGRGVCPECRKVKAEPGFKVCAACRERNRAANKAIREERAANHECIRCGTRLETDEAQGKHRSRCQACLDKAAEATRKSRERKARKGGRRD